ncbi:MAG: hypothetical protein EXS37_00935 [Opitutus sp.]|nr:hypothetical protein [Opitutus sp.]
MKPTALLLVASLLTNIALVAVYVTRAPAPDRLPTAAARSAGLSAVVTAKEDALRAALASGDTAALQAAGVSPEQARELALGRTFSQIAARARATQAKGAGDARWWRNRGNAAGPRGEQLTARREFSEALTAAFGDDLGIGGGDSSQLAFLPPEKRDALRRITQDYDEMMAGVSAGGPQLASDREKLRLLRAERDRDITALLTPDERLAYEMRNSPSGATVRNRYGEAIESEAEFQKIYALQKAFDEKFSREALSGRISPEVLRARNEAERQLEGDLRTAVGTDRYAALRRAADPDLRMIDSLVSRLNLPAATGDRIAAARETFAAESQRINSDASVPPPQRRTQIQELAARARTELTGALGGEAAAAYVQNSQWVNLLQNGTAYATTPATSSVGSMMGASLGVYPVMPAGISGPGGARQVIINATANGPVSDTFVHGVPGEGGNMRVMTFSTSTTETTGPAGGPSSVQRTIIVAPSDPGQPPVPPKP